MICKKQEELTGPLSITFIQKVLSREAASWRTSYKHRLEARG